MKIVTHEDDCEMVVGNERVVSEGSGYVTQDADGKFIFSSNYAPTMSQSSPRRCTCNPEVFDASYFMPGGSE